MNDAALPKGYEPKDVEQKWRDFWEAEKSFTPDPENAKGPDDSYSIVIPPPNVTGVLHMGHALNLTLQDILCRYHRQRGRTVLWVPGSDHAGIATQNVVERQLASENLTRHDLGREKFVERVWQWKEDYGGRIKEQIKAMGASVDWSRERFTLDSGLSRAVREVFVRLYEEGLIYKGEYIINWCNRCHTALADDEVDHEQRKDKIWQIHYPLTDGSGQLTVATTRPETMLGDTAVAVHPEDERYAHLIGKTVTLPLVGRELPVIGDTYVDKEFGTGCLKVTPAHDMNDWELGRKHNLDIISVMDDSGHMNENAPERFQGMPAKEARQAVLAELTELGLLGKVEDIDHAVGHCYRCKNVIEPHVSTQWFVAVKPLAEEARKAVEDGRTTIYPEQWVKTYNHWLDNIRDWCVSRQLWWGHRIPAWTCRDCGKLLVSREDLTTCPECGGAVDQEEDVLDTWFSSALWPFSTLGWPDETRELDVFYPTSVLVTAFDILFFWVARMMMMGLHFMGKQPFDDVYIHALVRDAEGKKMSKSLGNILNPLEMIDQFGCDSLRLTLAALAAMGRDIRLSPERIEGYRHFVNKLWNAARFALMKLDDNLPEYLKKYPVDQAQGIHHQWILHRLEEIKVEVSQAIPAYRFNDAAQALYHFTWHEFCDWYLEMIKPEMSGDDPEAAGQAQAVLHTVLKELLILMHPIMPYVTQEIWSHLPAIENANLAAEPWPAGREDYRRPEAVAAVELIQESVVSVRNIRAELNIGPSVPLVLKVHTVDEGDRLRLLDNEVMISTLARLKELEASPDMSAPKAAASAVVKGHHLFVPLEGAIDFQAELARLDKELAKLDKDLTGLNKKLANESFVQKAPAEVVAKERERAEELGVKQGKLAELKERIKSAME